MSKLLVVLGATGTQGGSTVRAVQNDASMKGWKIRAVTRDASSAKAKQLESSGVEAVSGNLDDKDSLVKAFEGADAVFAVTNYWDKVSYDVEYSQGKNIADAAKEARVRHLIFSSLDDVKKSTNGRFDYLEHFQAKAAVQQYILDQGIPSSFVLAGFYMENFVRTHLLRFDENSKTYQMAFPVRPDQKFAMIAMEADFGKFVKAAIKAGPTQQDILAATGEYSPNDVIETFKKVYPSSGKGAAYTAIDADTFENILASAGLPRHGAHDLRGNFELFNDIGGYGGRSIAPSLAMLEEPVTTLEQFMKTDPDYKNFN